jgi:hypothetical protein
MKYFHPKSLTWWAAMVSILIGLAKLAGVTHPSLAPLSELIVALSGGADTSPVAMILGGLALIGLRDKMERMQ